ncbi:hypothetical protein NMY22_g935 [Coprinellus aureogranulatus]|nr:hypothetical protein NMY22_g935 [Coprinellus aureogranulatus]
MAATETPGFTGLFVQPPEKAGSYGISANAMSHRHHVWKYSLSIPFLFSIVSALILVLHVAITRRAVIKLLHRLERRKNEDINETLATAPPSYESTFPEEIKERAEKHGGAWLFSLKFMRLLGCIVFLFLTTYTAVLNEESCHTGTCKNNIKGKKKKSRLIVSERELQDLGMCLTSLYAAFLSLVTVGNKRRWSRIATHHLNLVLLVCLAVYACRDVLPLATFTLSPSDRKEGWVLWAKVTLLSLVALVYPLCVPRKYIPVNPEEPAETPSPEQTASLFSLTTFAFLDRLVRLGNQVSHISSDLLPPLADYDCARNLRKRSLPILDKFTDPKHRHLFFGLLHIFKAEYLTLSIMIGIQVLAGFASPIGIKQLLNYIETGGVGATIKPWFWILWLFLGPTINSVAYQWYMYIATRVLVRVECILTELVFEHSLKVRVRTMASEKVSELGCDDATGASNLVGMINNLVTTDLANIADGRDFLYLILFVPLQISLCVVFLYRILGWSAFVGMSVMVALFPLPGYIANRTQCVQIKRMATTDARVDTVSEEVMSVLRMVKMFGWEQKMFERISGKRDQELKYVRMRQMLDFMNGILNWMIPIATMVASYATFRAAITSSLLPQTVIMKQPLSASIVFSSITVFDMLKAQLHIVFFVLNQVIAGKVSLDRMDDFFKKTELLDELNPEVKTRRSSMSNDLVGFHNASFSWSGASGGAETPYNRRFVLTVQGYLLFAPKKVNLIVGPTGCGKTSLLMALLGEMHYIPMSPDSWFNLPRHGGVAYAAQESWIQNETIRDNILFGSTFDEERYSKVIYQCGLTRDLAFFEAGDRTEVGEKGLTLSGGQKARITLARALYSQAQTLLLDDVLAALDVHTSKWIVDQCLSGDLIRDRTVLLVTHNIALTRPIADYVVSIGANGQILSRGSVVEAVELDVQLAKEIETEEITLNEAVDVHTRDDISIEPTIRKLIIPEEVEEGHISWSAAKMYLSGMGGGHPVLFFAVCLTSLGLCEVGVALQTWFLGYWASKYNSRSPVDVPVLHYVGLYVLCLVVSISIYIFAYITYLRGAIRASRTIHNNFVQSILGTTMRWLDTTPISRVLARCTQDMRAIDGPISAGLFYFGEITFTMLARFASVVLFTPIFIVPGLVMAGFGGLCAQLYIQAQLSVKREMSAAKAPVLGHLGTAVSGLVSLRAYEAQEVFIKESMRRIDRYTRAASAFHNLNRWVCLRVDALTGLFAAALATYLVYFNSHGASNTGFSLNMAGMVALLHRILNADAKEVGFSTMILWWIQRLNELEVQGNSLERVERYSKIEQEANYADKGTPPAYWPSSGKLEVTHLSARYSPDGPNVLKDISFSVEAGERIGIVGRTGSGKSSLTLAILRCIFCDGQVIYDGIDTSKINLHSLRSSVTIIPQVPELLSGTIRQNLDPFEQYDDAVLNSALRSSGLFSLHKNEEPRITLDTQVSTSGLNLSVGQRQILALARALVRANKLLILDEATSAIDHETDTIIQSLLRHQLNPDVTVITVAHRLHTIMDADKIMVLDAGQIVEFDKPSKLLRNPKGELRALVEESGDKEHLFGMANFQQ